jgi:hypothetical protein
VQPQRLVGAFQSMTFRETLKEIDRRIERVACVFNPQTAPYIEVFLRSIEATQRLFTVTTA